jgi:hypothetical protein
MDPLTIGLTLAGAGAGLFGAREQRKAAEGQTETSERMRREAMQAIQNFGQQALAPLAPAFQRSQDIRQESANRALALAGSMFRPQLEQFRGGNYMAQQRIAQAQPFMQSAILGIGSLGYMPTAQNVGGQLDYSVLRDLGLKNYASDEPAIQMQFTPVPGGQGQAATQAATQAPVPNVDQMQQAMLRFQTDGQIPL